MSVPGWLAAENPDPVAPRDPRASRGMAVIRSGDRRCAGGPTREKVAGACFTAPAPRLYAVEGRNGPFSLGATVRGSGVVAAARMGGRGVVRMGLLGRSGAGRVQICCKGAPRPDRS